MARPPGRLTYETAWLVPFSTTLPPLMVAEPCKVPLAVPTESLALAVKL